MCRPSDDLAQKAFKTVASGIAEKFLGRIFLYDLTVRHKQYTCRNFLCESHFVSYHNHCHVVLGKLAHNVQNLAHNGKSFRARV